MINNISLKKQLLAGVSAITICTFAFGAFAAEQADQSDDSGATTALLAGNSATFGISGGATDIFSVANGVAVGDSGVVVSATTSDAIGVLTFLGSSVATGTIGSTSNRLSILNAGVAGTTVTISGATFTKTTNITGTGTLSFAATNSGILDFDADGTVNYADGANQTFDNNGWLF